MDGNGGNKKKGIDIRNITKKEFNNKWAFEKLEKKWTRKVMLSSRAFNMDDCENGAINRNYWIS